MQTQKKTELENLEKFKLDEKQLKQAKGGPEAEENETGGGIIWEKLP